MVKSASTPAAKKPAAKTTSATAAKKPAVKKTAAATPSSKAKPAAKTAATPVKKTTAAKPAPANKAQVKSKGGISAEERYRMIATAAYYLAECRGFAGGYEMADWITAEMEIDRKIKS